MIEKPFLLDPGYEKLLASGAFRQRFIEKLLGRPREPFVILAMAQLPTVMLIVLGFLVDARAFYGAALWGGCVCLMIGIGGLHVYFDQPRRNRLKRFAYEGELLTGRLVSCLRKHQGPPEPADPGTYYVEVQFEATAPSGKEIKGTATSKRVDLLLDDPLPLPGTPVLVLMLDETLYALL